MSFSIKKLYCFSKKLFVPKVLKPKRILCPERKCKLEEHLFEQQANNDLSVIEYGRPGI